MRRIPVGKLISIVILGIPAFVVLYTVVLSRIEPDQKSTVCPINPSGEVIFRMSGGGPMMYTTGGGSRELALLRGRLYSSEVWLGFSSFYGGVLILNRLAGGDHTDIYSVLRVDGSRRTCGLSSPLDLRSHRGEWGLIGRKAHRIDIRGRSVRLLRRTLGRSDTEQIVFESELPPGVVIDRLDSISSPSMAGEYLAFSVGGNVLVLDMQRKTIKRIASGAHAVFCSDHTLVIIPSTVTDANRLYIETYDFRTGRTANVDVWLAQGLQRLPVLLPMVPQNRPDEIKSVSAIPDSSLLLVEVTKLGYDSSYLFLVDISGHTSCRLPVSPSRGQWSWVPTGNRE